MLSFIEAYNHVNRAIALARLQRDDAYTLGTAEFREFFSVTTLRLERVRLHKDAPEHAVAVWSAES
ncbi:hypothetical protein KT71_003331 [Congregibacter litoralis KT71]|uniref:Uncharacterized protein n=1 Tax=Congregibacter litoralis KT71 TaxID=314285 RepID=V7HVH3_9GAMM|nr:hypothetical protein KT71_003331 [Congregibacter litoralis KT71]